MCSESTEQAKDLNKGLSFDDFNSVTLARIQKLKEEREREENKKKASMKKRKEEENALAQEVVCSIVPLPGRVEAYLDCVYVFIHVLT
jgi:aspartate carbamoyltransferase catalytic subunit